MEENKKNLPDFKYVITLDSDTNLSLNSATKLIGAMGHILNIPIIQENKVISGYGIMQPRIGLDLDLAKKSKFIEIYSVPRTELIYIQMQFQIFTKTILKKEFSLVKESMI